MRKAQRELMERAAEWRRRYEAELAARLEAQQRLKTSTEELERAQQLLARRPQEQGWRLLQEELRAQLRTLPKGLVVKQEAQQLRVEATLAVELGMRFLRRTNLELRLKPRCLEQQMKAMLEG